MLLLDDESFYPHISEKILTKNITIIFTYYRAYLRKFGGNQNYRKFDIKEKHKFLMFQMILTGIALKMVNSSTREASKFYQQMYLEKDKKYNLNVGYLAVFEGKDIHIEHKNQDRDITKKGFAFVGKTPNNQVTIFSPIEQLISVYSNLTGSDIIYPGDCLMFSNLQKDYIEPINSFREPKFFYFTNLSIAVANISKTGQLKSYVSVNNTIVSRPEFEEYTISSIRTLYIRVEAVGNQKLYIDVNSLQNTTKLPFNYQRIRGLYEPKELPTIIDVPDLDLLPFNSKQMTIIYFLIITGAAVVSIAVIGYTLYRLKCRKHKNINYEMTDLVSEPLSPEDEKQVYISAENITPAIPTNEMGEITIIHQEEPDNMNPYADSGYQM